MDDPERLDDADPPTCSIEECESLASAIIKGALLCGDHANQVMLERGLEN